MIEAVALAPLIDLTLQLLKSKTFQESIKKSSDRIKQELEKNRIENAKKEAQKSVDKTMEGLAEKQAEAITLENIYLNILSNRIK